MSNTAPRSKLPALTIIGQALRFPLINVAALLRLASLPFFAMLAATLLLRALAPSDSPSLEAMHRIFVVSPLVIIVLVEFVLPSYAVTVTMYLIAGPASVEGRSALAYSTTEFRYAVAALLMTLGFGAPTIVFIVALRNLQLPVGLTIALVFAWLAIALFIVMRLILLFPAIAAGGAASPRIACILTSRNFWRIATIALLTAIPYSILTTIVRIAAASLPSPIAQLLLAAILSAIVTLSWTTTLAWQALVYKHLAGSSDAFASNFRAV
ncbi:MAG TPA: hypothetical protein VMA09_10965 [Candidatus Binataceae bacterium]|nr:hypothetical protein [Candidatus Binataceae bacterium]